MTTDRLIVGLDFGTTFTGVAFVHSATPNDVEIIKTWPGGHGMTSDKVPSEIAYFGSAATRWGSLIKPNDSPIRCIKLLLDPSQNLPKFVSRAVLEHELHKSGKDAVEFASKRFSAALIGDAKIEFVLTVPAVWSDVAKDATLMAARSAGIAHDIRMISGQLNILLVGAPNQNDRTEPEAAACYTLKAIQPNHLNVDDHIVVCDAGGGTVDLITYEVTALDSLALKESTVGTGDLCGAAFLNYLFEDHVRERLGSATFEQLKLDKPKAWPTALERFEQYVKRNISEEDEEEYNIPFPGVPDSEELGFQSGFMALGSDDVRSIFDPIVKKVLKLLEDQVNAVQNKGSSVSAILLVGGFGQSQYLYERVEKHFRTALPPPYSATAQDTRNNAIVVMQPPNAWTAVARGAVLRGLEGTPVSDRYSRYNYGVRMDLIFDDSIHPAESKYWDDFGERWVANGGMRWHVRKGDLVAESDVFDIACCRKFAGKNFPDYRSLSIPQPLYSNMSTMAPIMFEDARTAKVCTLYSDLSTVPRHHFKQRKNSRGVWYWIISFKLTMRIDSAHLDFSLQVDGQAYGAVTATFNH